MWGADHSNRPVILFFNDFFGHPPDTRSLAGIEGCVFTTDRSRLREASAVVFHIPSMRTLGKVRKRAGQLWVAWSMESEVNYPLLADDAFMRAFDLTMTYKRSADIWCPYVPRKAAFEQALAKPVPRKTASAPVVMLQSSNVDHCGRNQFARELMSLVSVHSYGRFLNNRPIGLEDRGNETKLAIVAAYKFCIGFENSFAPDYVTEKFFDPILAGTVPVYRGAENVDIFAPGDHAFVDASRFSGPRDLAEFLIELDRDEHAYRQYFQWRQGGLSQQFKQLLAYAPDEPLCRLCEVVRMRP